MRIIDCIPQESSVFYSEKNDFIRPGFRQKPVRHYITSVDAALDFKEIYGG